MSGEPSATPVFTTTTTPVQDPLLAFEHPPKKPDHRVDGQVYIHKDGLLKGVRVKWSVSSKTYFCTCDTSVHDGNCETRRCPLLTGKRTCASAEVSQTVEEPTTRLAVGVSFSKATINNDRMQLDPGHLQSLTSIQHIPACSETKSPAITILQKGTWSDTMLQMPSWSGSIVTTGEPLRYPFRVGAKWRREIKGGKYAEVVKKAKVTVIFEIKLNAKTPETPVFSVRDYDEGVFAREFTAHSFSQLAMLWLTQNGQTGVTLAALNGKKFVGLDNPGVAEYFCSITSGFEGFRRNMRTRGAGDKGVEDIGSRQQRRLQASLLQDFETALGKVCPQDLGQAFELLQSSQAFKTRFLPDMHYRFAQDDKTTQSLVDMYKEAVLKADKKQAQWVLALYSPFHPQDHTMQLFQCSEHNCKQANLAHRIRNLPAPQKSCTVTVLSKETVEHMEGFSFRADNCVRAAFSNTKKSKFHLVMNRHRLFLKYTDECKRLCVKAMAETTFYSYYDKGIFKDMTRQTCCCTQCVNKGGVAFDILRQLCTTALGESLSTSEQTSWLNSIQNLEHFFERYYRGMLKISSDDCNMCMTLALSKTDDRNGRHECEHEHFPQSELMRQDVALLHALREAITLHSNDTDRKDHLWSLDRAEGLLNE